MSSRKRLLVLCLLICSLSQTQIPARAQAEPLVGLATRLIPIVLPIVLTTVPMIPLMIKQVVVEMPKPHLLHRKEAQKEVPANQPTAQEAAMPPQPPPQYERSHEEAQPIRTAATPVRRQRASDNSDWFMDDEQEQPQARAAQPAAPEVVPTAASAPKRRYRATESVHSEIIHPNGQSVEDETSPSNTTGGASMSQRLTPEAAGQTAERGEKATSTVAPEAETAPVIMMKVAE